MDDDEPLTLQEACDLLFRGNISPTTLRAEARRGRLVIERIGRKDFVTRASIKSMRKLCEVQPESQAAHPNANWPEEVRRKAALASCLATLETLKRMPRKK